MGIIVYYHITLLKNWETIVREQCTRIIFSGLYDVVESVRCYAIDINGDESEKCLTILRSFGSKFCLKGIELSGTEWVTLKNIQHEVNQDELVLYMHTKGVTRYNTTEIEIPIRQNGETASLGVPSLYENIENWRDLMEFFLVRHYKSCLKLFTENTSIDTIGINTCVYPHHYSGNFWWARGRYLLTLPYDVPMDEAWILSRTGRFVSLYQSPLIGYGHYFSPYPLSTVSDQNSFTVAILEKSVCYWCIVILGKLKLS